MMKSLSFLAACALSLTSAWASCDLMSYNVRRCRLDDGQIQYERFVELIKESRVNFVALQELVQYPEVGHKGSTGEQLATALKMHFSFGKAIPLGKASYGVGLLSVDKPVSVEQFVIESQSEKRTLLVCGFSHFRVGVTHFPLTEAEQLAAVDVIVEALKQYPDKPFILMGDLNAQPDSPVIQKLLQFFTPVSDLNLATFPADKPRILIDYILVDKQSAPSFKVVESLRLLTGSLSDHVPVLVRLRGAEPAPSEAR